MKKIILLILIVIASAAKQSYGQNKKMDSLKVELGKATQDTSRLRIYIALCDECPINDNLLYAVPAEKLANKLLTSTTNEKERKRILNRKAEAYLYFSAYYEGSEKADSKKAMEYYEKRKIIYQETGEKIKAANLLLSIGGMYHQQGNTPKCLESYHDGLLIADSIAKEAKRNGDSKKLKEANKTSYNISYQLAYIYASLNDTTTAFEYNSKLKRIAENAIEEAKRTGNKDDLKEAKNQLAYSYWNIEQLVQVSNQPQALDACDKILSIFEDLKDTQRIATAYNLKALIFQDQKKYTTALDCFNNGLKLCKENRDDGIIGMILGNIGRTYELQEQYTKALEYYFKCIKLKRTYMYHEIGNIYFKMKDYKKAEDFSNKAYEIDKKSGNPNTIGFVAKSLSDVYRAEKKFDKALDMFELYIKMRDSTNNEGLRKSTMQKKFQYDYEKKQLADKEEQEKKML